MAADVPEGNALDRYIGVGAELRCVPDLASTVSYVQQLGLSFVLTPLVHRRHRRRAPASSTRSCKEAPAPLTRSDLTLTVSQWSSSIVGDLLAPWSHLDAPNHAAFQLLQQEIAWAAHIGTSISSTTTSAVFIDHQYSVLIFSPP